MQEHVDGLLHGTGGGDGAAIDEEDLVGVLDGVEAVRDDNARGGGR